MSEIKNSFSSLYLFIIENDLTTLLKLIEVIDSVQPYLPQTLVFGKIFFRN